MKAIIQRVRSAKVEINKKTVGEIQKGLLILLGIKESDGKENTKKLIKKIINLRVFPDDNEVMNLSSLDVKAELLIVSNFTVYGNTKKGNRPSYIEAAKPDIAKDIYEDFLKEIKSQYPYKIDAGEFQAMMIVSLENDGPVTLIVET